MILLTESSEVKYLCISFWLHNQSDRGWYQILTEVQIIESAKKSSLLSHSSGSLFLYANIFSADKPHFGSSHTPLHAGFSPAFYHISETLLKTWYWEIPSNLRCLHHPNLTPNQRPNECCFWPVLRCWRYYTHCVWICQAPAASWGPPGWEALIERVWEGG